MDDCPTFFEVPIPPAPVPVTEDFLWDYIDPLLQVCMTFPVDMDTTSLPPRSKFNVRINGPTKPISSIEWLNSRVLFATRTDAGLLPSVVRFRYTTQTGKLRTALGAEVEPFDLLGTEAVKTAEWIYTDPGGFVVVNFELNMNASIVPAVTDLVLTIDGVPIDIDNFSWIGEFGLLAEFSEAGLTPGVVEIALPTPVPNLQTAGGQQMLPFDLIAEES